MTWQHTGHVSTASVAVGGTSIQFGDGPGVDAFFRQRMSEPFTLFDSKQVWDDGAIANSAENFPLFWDNQETSGSGTTTTFNANRASTTLAVGATTSGTRVRQTRQRFNYQPGKSQLIILTGVAGNTDSGITKRLGYFDDNDGVFFQDVDGAWSVVVRSNVSGSPVNTVVAQTAWNLDVMDGTGGSGVTLDPTKSQILFIDLEWLGTGRIRFGFFVDGLPIYVHQFLNANSLASVYMSTPNLPVRAEISNDGSGGADSLEQICATVISEGGLQINGVTHSGNLGALAASEIQATTVDTTYAVCGIQLKAAYLSATVVLKKMTIIETASGTDPFLWSIHFNPTLTSGLTYSNLANSAVQFGVGDASPADVISDDGTVLESGYVSGALESFSLSIGDALHLGSLIDGTVDQIVLGVTPLTASQDILGSLTWQEAW